MKPEGERYCESCKHIFLPYPSADEEQALCMMHKNVGGKGYVSRKAWAGRKPYLKCDFMNPRGACPLYEERDKPLFEDKVEKGKGA